MVILPILPEEDDDGSPVAAAMGDGGGDDDDDVESSFLRLGRFDNFGLLDDVLLVLLLIGISL